MFNAECVTPDPKAQLLLSQVFVPFGDSILPLGPSLTAQANYSSISAIVLFPFCPDPTIRGRTSLIFFSSAPLLLDPFFFGPG